MASAEVETPAYKPECCRESAAFNDDDCFSLTSTEQKRVEDTVRQSVRDCLAADEGAAPSLQRLRHAVYLRKCLQNLGRSFETLDASRPWLVYWLVHSLALLNEPLPDNLRDDLVSFLRTCQAPTGGYGGGPGQLAHLATTYAAVMALCTIGTPAALRSVDRPLLYQFLCAVKQPDGGFALHAGGEEDVRGAYCALAVAALTNMLSSAELSGGAAEWLVSCQTYEGGFGGVRGAEAHGGYTFCALAALLLLGRQHLAHLPSLLRWLVSRQAAFEGGFQGRTNKLVDGCYSFWQGGCFPIIEEIISERAADFDAKWLYNNRSLQEFVLMCCQDAEHGGLSDKPDKLRDPYHTCYTLSGLSTAQHYFETTSDVLGDAAVNQLEPTHPVFNIVAAKEHAARAYFHSLDAIVKRWW